MNHIEKQALVMNTIRFYRSERKRLSVVHQSHLLAVPSSHVEGGGAGLVLVIHIDSKLIDEELDDFDGPTKRSSINNSKSIFLLINQIPAPKTQSTTANPMAAALNHAVSFSKFYP